MRGYGVYRWWGRRNDDDAEDDETGEALGMENGADGNTDDVLDGKDNGNMWDFGDDGEGAVDNTDDILDGEDNMVMWDFGDDGEGEYLGETSL